MILCGPGGLEVPLDDGSGFQQLITAPSPCVCCAVFQLLVTVKQAAGGTPLKLLLR